MVQIGRTLCALPTRIGRHVFNAMSLAQKTSSGRLLLPLPLITHQTPNECRIFQEGFLFPIDTAPAVKGFASSRRTFGSCPEGSSGCDPRSVLPRLFIDMFRVQRALPGARRHRDGDRDGEPRPRPGDGPEEPTGE